MKKIVSVLAVILILISLSMAATRSWDLDKYGGKGTLYYDTCSETYWVEWDNGNTDWNIDQEFAKNWAAMMEMIQDLI